MGKSFVEKNIKEILESTKWDFPVNVAMASAWLIANKKGINLKILDLSQNTSLTDYFVLASAENSTQAKSMADEIVKILSKFKHKPLSQEGFTESDWTLIDYGDFIIHIFLESSRDLYGLDNLWSKASLVDIPQEFYFDQDVIKKQETDSSLNDYF